MIMWLENDVNFELLLGFHYHSNYFEQKFVIDVSPHSLLLNPS